MPGQTENTANMSETKIGSRCSDCSKKPECPVTSNISNKVLFISYNIALHCNKCMSFGNDFICLCEGRKKYFETFHQ